jgi:hypothetical protein
VIDIEVEGFNKGVYIEDPENGLIGYRVWRNSVGDDGNSLAMYQSDCTDV